MTNFLTYSKFHSHQEAQELINLLDKSGIEYYVDHERDVLDKIYTGESFDPMISIKIREDRFEELNAILLTEAESELTDIDPDYYLFSFTNQELLDVVNNRNEWNYFDQALAKKLLSERRIDIPIRTEKSSDAKIYSQIHLTDTWLIVEYLLSIVFSFAGIVIGLATIFAYKTLRSGEKVKIYDEPTRLHGRIMLGLGVLRTLIYFSLPWWFS